MKRLKQQQPAGPAQIWGVTISRAIGLVLVPLVIAGVFLWGLWEPTSRMNDVTAAVVNNDEPVEVNGQLTPLGRVLAAELIGETSENNFTWQLTNTEGAEEGLATGEFVTVITIPENFSAAATSAAEGPEAAEQATISIETSQRAKLLDEALAQAVMQTATAVLNTQLGEAFVGNVFVGFTELGEGLDGASDGAAQLADGADQLSSGVSELSAGVGELHTGTGQLVTGSDQLASGLRDFTVGTEQLAAGASELSGGASALAGGLSAYADGVQELADGTTSAAAGSAQLADGVDTYVGMINSVLSPLASGLTEATPYVLELREAILTGTLPVPPEHVDGLIALIDQVLEAPALVELAIAGGNELAGGARASAVGMDELAAGAHDLAAGAYGLADGAGGLAEGTGQLVSEIPALTTGAGALADGAGQLAGGIGDLSAGTGALADGAAQLADGAGQAAAGTHELAEGLAAAVKQIPRYTEAEREALAKVAVNPVTGADGEASLFSGSGAPLFLSIALWAGGLAAFTLLSPLWARTREAALSEASITVRSAGPGMLLGAAQGLLAALLIGLVLDAGATDIVAYLSTGALVGFAFALLNQGLVAFMSGWGRFIAFLVLVTGFVAGIVSTTPGVLGTIASLTPVGTAISAFTNIAETGAPGLGTTLMLCVWAGLGFFVIGAAVHRARAARNS